MDEMGQVHRLCLRLGMSRLYQSLMALGWTLGLKTVRLGLDLRTVRLGLVHH